jgi:hypothetical protein
MTRAFFLLFLLFASTLAASACEKDPMTRQCPIESYDP